VAKLYPDDLSGRQFGDLLIVKQLLRDEHGGQQYECLCACGNTCVAKRNVLVTSYKKSCGCLQKKLMKSKSTRFHAQDKSYFQLEPNEDPK
jgi:hypothetical protein